MTQFHYKISNPKLKTRGENQESGALPNHTQLVISSFWSGWAAGFMKAPGPAGMQDAGSICAIRSLRLKCGKLTSTLAQPLIRLQAAMAKLTGWQNFISLATNRADWDEKTWIQPKHI